jgi:hypothetical protein
MRCNIEDKPPSIQNIEREKRSYFENTHPSWIGDWGNEDDFYCRAPSPVIIIEFDHHSDVFLCNQEPAKFHIRTTLRKPNAGDYGYALREPDEKLR